jgi:hypothetical protein
MSKRGPFKNVYKHMHIHNYRHTHIATCAACLRCSVSEVDVVNVRMTIVARVMILVLLLWNAFISERAAAVITQKW